MQFGNDQAVHKRGSMGQGNQFEAAVVGEYINLPKMLPGFSLQGNKLIDHKQGNPVLCQQPLGAEDKFVGQVTVHTESLMEGRITQDKVEGLLDLVARISGDDFSSDLV